ncbi:cobalamin-dependent protein [Nisaea acidiphila]|uniref:Cobalamin-dependent protein n=1 Tax=Nisaea acidiphila TaxID=1862145 RepID=A0A9J7AWG5_9PROT|nr:radical SAM protein [Nisaea acidiphila]UUX51703.1 cobalamin-dependent protein [Nisaea acidiphila]
MKILMVIPRYVQNAGAFYHLPLGLGYVAAIAEQEGHEIQAINLNAHGLDYLDALRLKLLTFKPDLCSTGGLSAFVAKVQEILGICKEICPETTTIIGGGMLSGDPEPAMRMTGADIGVIGEGEDSFGDFLRTFSTSGDLAQVDGLIFRNDKGALVRNKPRAAIMGLDDLPWPNYDLLGFADMIGSQSCNDVYFFQGQPNSNPRSIDMITSRSCPFSCTFCFHPAGKVYRERDLEKFFEEVSFYKQKYDINMVQIVDELFSLRKDRLHEFCERMEPLGLQWLVQLHVNSTDRETLRKMERSGCSFISYGIESMDPTVLVSMKKKAKVERVDSALALTAEEKIGIQGNLIFGDTVETVETANNSLKWWSKNIEHGVYLNMLQVYPGSPDYIEAVRDGLISDRDHFVNELPVNVNISRMNEANRSILSLLINTYSNSLFNIGNLTSFEIAKRQIEGRSLAYDLTFECPSCGSENHYESAIFDHRENSSFRVTCRSCRVRSHIPNPLQETSSYRVRNLQLSRLEEAKSKLAEQDFATAKEILNSILALEGISQTKAAAYYLTGQIERAQSNAGGALLGLSKAVTYAPFNAGYHVEFARLLRDLKIYGGAAMHYRQALKLRPDDPQATQELSQLENDPAIGDKEVFTVSVSNDPPPQRRPREKKTTRVRHADKLKLGTGRFDTEPEFAHLEPVA